MSAPDPIAASPVFAWVTLDDDGLPSLLVGYYALNHGQRLPLASFRDEVVRVHERHAAEEFHRLTGQRVALVRFEPVEIIEELP